MNDQEKWKRDTAVRKVQEDQNLVPAPPLAHSIVAAASYVGASATEVERWWRGRGR